MRTLLVFSGLIAYAMGAFGIPGGYSDHPIDHHSKVLADFAMATFTHSGDNNLGKSDGSYELKKVETQVVAGINYRFTVATSFGGHNYTCQFVVFEQSWTKTQQLSSSDCKPMRKRQLGRPLVGGVSAVSCQDTGLLDAVDFVLDRINAMSNSMYKFTQSNLEHCSKQVVAGFKYSADITVQESSCMQSDQTKALHCAAKNGGMVEHFHFSVVEQSWMPDKYQYVQIHPIAMKKVEDQANQSDVLKYQKSIDRISNVVSHGGELISYFMGDNNKVLEKGSDFIKEFMGKNGKDLTQHGKEVLDKLAGKDKNELKQHGKDILKKLLGADNHGKNMLLGSDDHDLKPHGKAADKGLLGGDDHDLLPHGQIKKPLIGGDDHDLKPHGQIKKSLIGGDDHDLLLHGQIKKPLIGGDDHDLKPHGQIKKPLIGGDDHDLKPHGQIKKPLIGGDDHDLKPHGQLKKPLIGGDDHDLKPHGQLKKPLIGGDDHDLKPHGQLKKPLIGGDDHDLKPHGQIKKPLIGGDDHDLLPHGQIKKPLIGGDDHDLLPHGQIRKPLIGGDDHDLKPHGNSLIGGDDHDLCHRGMFEDFKKSQNKLYESEKEETKRFNIFCKNMKTAKMLQDSEKGTARYGATMFADMTESEFKQYVGKPWDLNGNDGMDKAVIPEGDIPESFDWRDHNAVTEVKNQGACGSCWAFSTTGNIEGQWAIKKQKLVSLSEQELVDCDKVDEGCNGGLPSNAYKEIIRLGGLETESEYKYEGKDEKCHFNKSEVRVKISGSVSISQNETEMAAWLAKNGPISIGINAFAMQFYTGGISHPWRIFCNPKNLDHGVLIVGYGVESGKPYWIIKNSWGPSWGEKGYYLVYRGGGVCGLNTMCTSSVVN